MTDFVRKIKWGRFAFAVLIMGFFLALLNPFVRESNVLCARLLLQLKGETYVQGFTPGCIIHAIPEVQFTEQQARHLRARSTNSLEDFVLAFATGDQYHLGVPKASPAFANSPLLTWATLKVALLAGSQSSDATRTNLASNNEDAQATIQNALKFVRLAQIQNPTNGAFWVAEAALRFAEKDEMGALAALRTGATNRVWTVDSEATFEACRNIFMQGGLKELEATSEACNELPSDFFIVSQARCLRAIAQMLIVSVERNETSQFAALLRLLSELRRADCFGRSHSSRNAFRSLSADIDLANALANKLGEAPLPDSGSLPYDRRWELQNRLFDKYSALHADPEVAAAFVSQRESFNTEKALRSYVYDIYSHSVMSAAANSIISGCLALLCLTLLLGALIFESCLACLRRLMRQSGGILKSKRCWTVVAFGIIAGTVVCANCWFRIGLNHESGLRVAESAPVIDPDIATVLVSLLIWVCLFAAVITDMRKGKFPDTRWCATFIFGLLYLVSTFAMALLRHETAVALARSAF